MKKIDCNRICLLRNALVHSIKEDKMDCKVCYSNASSVIGSGSLRMICGSSDANSHVIDDRPFINGVFAQYTHTDTDKYGPIDSYMEKEMESG